MNNCSRLTGIVCNFTVSLAGSSRAEPKTDKKSDLENKHQTGNHESISPSWHQRQLKSCSYSSASVNQVKVIHFGNSETQTTRESGVQTASIINVILGFQASDTIVRYHNDYRPNIAGHINGDPLQSL